MRNRISLVVCMLAIAACDCGDDRTRSGGGLLRVEEGSLDFGKACPAPTDPSLPAEPAVAEIHLSNAGGATLYVNRFEVEPSRAALFQVDEARVPESLAAGERVAVPIYFQPVAAGVVVADLTVVGEDESAPAVVKLMGEGLDLPPNPVLALSCTPGKWSNDSCSGMAANYFFVDTPVQSMSEVVVTVANQGCAQLRAEGARVTTTIYGSEDPATFALADGQPTSLVVGGGQSAAIKARFAPKAEGSFVGELAFATNDPASPRIALPLRGLGVKPVLVLEPALCDFRDLSAPCAGAFSVSNAGGDALTIQSVRIQSGNPMFEIARAPASGDTIAAGASAANSIEIRYLPGPRKASDLLVVESSGGTGTAELRGGSPPVLRTEPEATLGFGANLSVQDHFLPLRIENVATYARQLPLTLRSIEIDSRPPSNAGGTFSLASSGAPECPAAPAPGTQLAPGQSIALCVRFSPPQNGGSFYANLLLGTDDPSWPAPDGMLVVLSASTTCDPAPVAEITAALGAPCPCGSGQECVGSECHAIGSSRVSLSSGSAVLSGEKSWDLLPDSTGACTVRDSSAIRFWEWSLLGSPAGSTPMLSPQGKVSANRTTLSFDEAGNYVVGLSVWDASGLESASTSFAVTVDP